MNIIEPNTATNAVYTIYPIYSLIFLFLIGFVYHLIRNNEYKKYVISQYYNWIYYRFDI